MLHEDRQHQGTWEKEQMSLSRDKQIPDPLKKISAAVAAEVVVERWHNWNYFIIGREMQHWSDPDNVSHRTRLVFQTIMGRWTASKMTCSHFMSGSTILYFEKQAHNPLNEIHLWLYFPYSYHNISVILCIWKVNYSQIIHQKNAELKQD